MDPNSSQIRYKFAYQRLTLPVWVFIVIVLLTLLIYLFPPDAQQIYSPQVFSPDLSKPQSLFLYPLGLPQAAASCSNKCLMDVCIHWVPGPSDECPNPGKGGGCCLEYAQKCDPNCNEGDQAPSVSGNVTCDDWGQNGWCVNNAQLVLTGSDPQGYGVTINGEMNGSPFTCGTSCAFDLPVGTGIATYIVSAATSNLTNSGSTAWAYDPQLPAPTVNLSGTQGKNGWYVSPVSVSANGTDAISGIAGASIFVDGGIEQPSATLNDGVHQIVVSAVDKAGNTNSSGFTLKVDTTTPIINSSIAGAPGANGWYASELQASASADDADSGVDIFEVSVDGEAYQVYAAPIVFTEGYHQLQFKAIDKAGNEIETPLQEFHVDTIGPTIDLPETWSLGDIVSYEVVDRGSGLNSVRVVIEDENERYDKLAWEEDASGTSFAGEIDWNGKFKDGTTAPSGTYLVWVKASDQAGNESVKLGRVALEASLFSRLLPPKLPKTPKPTPMTALIATQPSFLPSISTNPVIVTDVISAGGTGNVHAGETPVPVNTSLPLVSAAVAAMAAAATYAAGLRQKDGDAPSGYQIKIKAKKLAEAEAERERIKAEQQVAARKLEQEEDEIEEAYRRSRVVSAVSSQRAYDDIEDLRAGRKDAVQQTTASKPWWQSALDIVTIGASKAIATVTSAIQSVTNGNPKVLGSSVSDTMQTGNPPPWQPIVDFVNWIGSTIGSIFGGNRQPKAKPTPDMNDIFTQIAPTIFAQRTQTAQVRPKSTPTLRATLSPTPMLKDMWVSATVRLRADPSVKNPDLAQLEPYTQVQLTGESVPGYDQAGNAVTFYKVFVPSGGQTGWVVSNLLDPNVFSAPLSINPNRKVDVPIQYPAGGQEQYLRINSQTDTSTGKMSIDPNLGSGSPYTHYNLCGEFSAAYVTRRPIDVLITDWVNQSAGYMQDRAREAIRNYDVGKKQPQLTSIDDIKNMLDQYNCSYKDFQTPLWDKVVDGTIVTPNRLKSQIDEGYALILGVKINDQGALAQGDIGHWVVVDDVAPQGINNGQVLIYNPMVNRQQAYDYGTLLEASGNFNGASSGVYPSTINATGLWVNLASCKP